MSVIAKILIVLNLLLAVVFLGAAATFLGQQESWKIKHDKLTADKAREISDLQANLEAARKTATEQERASSTLQQELADQKARLETKEGEYAQVTERVNTLLGQLERLSQTYKDAIEQNKQLTTEKDNLVTEKDQALTEKRNAIEEMNNANTETKRLASELLAAQDNLAEMEKRMTGMADENDSLTVQLAAYKNQFGLISAGANVKPMKAKVSRVDPRLNIVLLSVGRDDGVQVGYTFTIYRGTEYVGQVKVDKVEKDYCSGYSVKEIEKSEIRAGDDAATKL